MELLSEQKVDEEFINSPQSIGIYMYEFGSVMTFPPVNITVYRGEVLFTV